MICAICGNQLRGYGHNPQPVLPYWRRVCDSCNALHIMPIRFGANQVITTYDGTVLDYDSNNKDLEPSILLRKVYR